MPVTNWGSSSSTIPPAGNVFLYEALCGGSGIGNEEALPGSLRCEGAAMLQALIDDFSQLPGWQVWTMLDRRPGIELDVDTGRASHIREILTADEHQAAFLDLVRQADAVLVVADDVNLPLGRLRAREGGSDGGHHGFSSIIETLGTEGFARLRVGVGRGDERRDLADHVLARFDEAERDEIKVAIQHAADAVDVFVSDGIDAMMNRFNRC